MSIAAYSKMIRPKSAEKAEFGENMVVRRTVVSDLFGPRVLNVRLLDRTSETSDTD